MESSSRIILERIQEFLISRLDPHSRLYAENTQSTTVGGLKGSLKKKPFSILQIYQIDYIYIKICIDLKLLFQYLKIFNFIQRNLTVSRISNFWLLLFIRGNI